MDANTARQIDDWEAVFEKGDQDAFRELANKHMDVLLASARRDLRYYKRNDLINEQDFTPEELVGEGLIHAWKHRDVKPDDMSLRSWLIGTQHRVTHGLVRNLRKYRREKDISLDEKMPLNEDAQDTQEWFWDWYQPERELTWEDVIPSKNPEDVEIDLDEDREQLLVDTDTRHALVLHDEFELSLPDVAFTINRSPDAVAELLEQARAGLRERTPGGDADDRAQRPPSSD